MRKTSRETEIAYFELKVLVEEKVAKFEITVDDSMLVDVLKSLQELESIVLHFELCQYFSALK